MALINNNVIPIDGYQHRANSYSGLITGNIYGAHGFTIAKRARMPFFQVVPLFNSCSCWVKQLQKKTEIYVYFCHCIKKKYIQGHPWQSELILKFES
jgi:hypothetical protein